MTIRCAAIFLALLPAVLNLAPRAAAAEPKPNVVFILADDADYKTAQSRRVTAKLPRILGIRAF
jgi:hypothetical protein